MTTQKFKDAQNLRDSALITQILNGNNNAFTKILNHHWAKLYSYNYSLIHNRQTAEDATLDEFMKLYETIKAGKFKPGASIKGWLILRAKHHIIDLFRKRTPNLIFTDKLPDTRSAEPHYNASYNPKSEILHAAYKNLPPKHKKIILLRLFKNQSWKQIASHLNITENGASGTYARIIKKLKNNLIKKIFFKK